MRAWLVVAIVATAGVAHADRVTVKVIEVAGGIAYVEPGGAAGLRPGTKVKLPSGEREVIEVTATTAAVRLDGAAVAVGDTGTVDVTPGTHTTTARRATPRPPDAFREQWPEPVHPADLQAPANVPLGAGARGGAVHLTVLGNGYAAIDRSHRAAQGEARVIASFDLLQDRPLAADVDVAGRVFSEGYDKTLRPPVVVRAAQLRWGDAIDPRLALGRLRFAAASVGMLDGGRAATKLGDLELAAFGGLVPDPISGKPDTGTARFGAETIYDAASSAWQPRLGVTASGSTWDGKIDERRLAVTASANHGTTWLDGWAEAQAFPSGNPWGASAVELTGAGVSAEWRQHGDHLGADLGFLRPERSLRLAAALPPEWLCTQSAQPGDVTESCRGGDYWTTASASAGLRRGIFVVDAIGTVGRSHTIATAYTSSAYMRSEVHLDRYRLVIGGSAGRAELASWTAGEGGFGGVLVPKVDAEVRYRAELLDYVAGSKPLLMHTVATDLRYVRSTSLDLGISALGTTGPDRSALAVLTTIAWRPLP